MNLSFDEAMFYKVLLQSGFKEDVDKWVEEFINSAEELNGIYLDISICYYDINEFISCLQNYIGNNSINDKEVCNRLRNFIKEKLDNEEITIERAIEALISFGSNKWQEEYWSDFYMVSFFDEYQMAGIADQVEIFAMIREFINTGKRLDNEKFWSERNKKYKEVQNKENKYKFWSAIVLIIYTLFIMGLSEFFLWLEKHLTGSFSDKTMAIHIILMGLLIITPIVICVVGWDMVYDRLTTRKNKHEKIKEERKLIEQRRKKESEAIRDKFNLPSNILTSYEYNSVFVKKYFSKVKWILLAVFELLCLSMTVGSVFYFDLVTPELGITIILFGIAVGIYGFCVLCDAPKKGVIYSLCPVLCYAIPLVFVYYVIRIDTDWILGLSTITCGSLLFWLFMYLVVVKPIKKQRIASIKYWNLLEEKYPNLICEKDYFRTSSSIVFYKKDGTNVVIFEFKNGWYSITLNGEVFFEGVTLKDSLLYYEEKKDTLENCVKVGIELLENSQTKTII